MLLTWHNLTFYQDLVGALRDAIVAGRSWKLAEHVFEAYRRAP
jgi:queuine/archaeosine tRNA-ribosyltransferase